ncbi:cysteine desulfurase family protein [uncultured Tessaracoccus sp.]|uniref:cysteine desulfurase family protein n=1 Tax=uncultured Tessaracoccus sp. TaxID=905023 RepID=UPI002605BDC7|nr:cysteine desulfurase family protein [uncultured Tessaracoccus sp.]
MGTAYMDHAATSPMRPEAIAALNEHLDVVGNPSALHRAGQRARAALEEAREQLAQVVGCQPAEVIFTSGGSEADSIAVLGGWRTSGRERCVVSAIEHDAVLGAIERGADVIPVTGAGVVDVGAAEALIDDRVGVVSVMTVNNETGIEQPVDAVRRLALKYGAWMHTDAVQALGHVPLDFAQMGVDMMSLSAHKLGGPVGIGALIARRSIQPTPLGLGGGQERGVRSGTAMVALAASFAAAARVAVEQLDEEAARLRTFQAQIVDTLETLGATVNTTKAPHAPHIVNATFPQIRAGDLLFLLDQRGVQASVGSACRAGVHQPSKVLMAMGRTEDEAASTLRFSLGWSTTAEEVDLLCDELRRCLQLAQLAF